MSAALPEKRPEDAQAKSASTRLLGPQRGRARTEPVCTTDNLHFAGTDSQATAPSQAADSQTIQEMRMDIVALQDQVDDLVQALLRAQNELLKQGVRDDEIDKVVARSRANSEKSFPEASFQCRSRRGSLFAMSRKDSRKASRVTREDFDLSLKNRLELAANGHHCMESNALPSAVSSLSGEDCDEAEFAAAAMVRAVSVASSHSARGSASARGLSSAVQSELATVDKPPVKLVISAKVQAEQEEIKARASSGSLAPPAVEEETSFWGRLGTVGLFGALSGALTEDTSSTHHDASHLSPSDVVHNHHHHHNDRHHSSGRGASPRRRTPSSENLRLRHREASGEMPVSSQ